jgi:CHAT domain-containing protein
LQRQLPQGSAFIDLFRYTLFEQDPKVAGRPGEKSTPHYLAFVLTRDTIQRVELGEAALAEAALDGWLRALQEPGGAPATDVLRGRLWEPLARCLPAGTDTVYLAPDGALSRLPWAALPGDKLGTVLLERYTFAVVPHGRFLLARLRERKTDEQGARQLAVGGIRYDDRPAPAASPAGEQVTALPPERDGALGHWSELLGTALEVERLRALAGPAVQTLTGREASSARLLRELPRARLAHLATHGFFAQKAFLDEQRREQEQWKTWQLQEKQTTALVGLGARNPLAFSGLVCAGANRPEEAGPDGGVLTGEALISLPLEKMQLAVLSACQTGLGVEANGECVYGLQRAFHVAGCKNVVASLWRVDDYATAALMERFYEHLLRDRLPPLESLRKAQLAMRLHYDPVEGELRDRGQGPRVTAGPRSTKPAAPRKEPLPPRYWAAFVLSGLGR